MQNFDLRALESSNNAKIGKNDTVIEFKRFFPEDRRMDYLKTCQNQAFEHAKVY